MTPYECGTCGSTSLRIEPLTEGWRVSCGNGHPVAPSLGTVILAETGETRETTGRPTSIPEHLDEAERLLALAYLDNRPERAPGGYYGTAEFHTTQITAAESPRPDRSRRCGCGAAPSRRTSRGDGDTRVGCAGQARGRRRPAWRRSPEAQS